VQGYVQILHSPADGGRHWLTSMTIPPLQLLPVAANHCRVGSAIIRALAEHLEEAEELDRIDLGGAAVDLAMLPSPRGEDRDDEDEASLFLTPQPPQDWRDSYDEWIVSLATRLGLEPPAPDLDGSGYDRALAQATQALATRLPALRDRFLAGMNGLNLGFKFGLPTRRSGTEFVWLQPTDWSDSTRVRGILQSQPHDCKGYKLGQAVDVATGDLIDYAVGSETAGLVESGPTQRVAEDYGLVLS
jgi:uncharacterized protein YegJ (DUF2314 family)